MVRTFKALRGVVVAACLVTGLAAAMPGGAIASGLKVCVQEKEGGSIKLPKEGVCKKGYKLTEIGAEGKEGPKGEQGKEGPKGEPGLSTLSKSEQAALKEILPYVKFVKEGIDNKPTIQFSAANVQVVNGEGSTETTNGEGNLVIGYETTVIGPRTGSHNLLIGEAEGWALYGGLNMCPGATLGNPFEFHACGPFTS